MKTASVHNLALTLAALLLPIAASAQEAPDKDQDQGAADIARNIAKMLDVLGAALSNLERTGDDNVGVVLVLILVWNDLSGGAYGQQQRRQSQSKVVNRRCFHDALPFNAGTI